METKAQSEQIEQGERFQFGENWRAFLSGLNEERIIEAEKSLKTMLALPSLSGKSFLDAGSGSGLFSLAARRLGAEVYSFDYDPASVACTRHLKSVYFDGDPAWVIEEGSVLDENYLKQLGKFDIVYSWGVLHHSGDLMKALETIITPVTEGGILYIAIYNDQGAVSSMWTRIKKLYCSGMPGRYLVKAVFLPVFTVAHAGLGVLESANPLKHFTEYRKKRGMSIYYDWIDWLGGYPFEVAKPGLVFDFFSDAGFTLTKLVTKNGTGCNEYVFIRNRHSFQ